MDKVISHSCTVHYKRSLYTEHSNTPGASLAFVNTSRAMKTMVFKICRWRKGVDRRRNMFLNSKIYLFFILSVRFFDKKNTNSKVGSGLMKVNFWGTYS